MHQERVATRPYMNILLLAGTYFPTLAGSTFYADTTLKHLIKREEIDKVILATPYQRSTRIIEKEKDYVLLRILYPNLNFENRLLKYINYLLAVFYNNFVIIFLFSIYRVDILHSAYFYHIFAHIPVRTPLIAYVPRVYDRKIRFNPKAVLCISENVLESQTMRYGKKTKVLKIEEPIKLPKVTKEQVDALLRECNISKKYICYIGNIKSSKGIYELLEGLKLLIKENVDINLILAGESKSIDVTEVSRSLGIQDNVMYLGPLPRFKIMALISKADILILPSKSEGLGRVCIEALYLGTRVIFPPLVTEFEQFCSDYVIDEISPMEIKNKIVNVMKEEEYNCEYPTNRHDPDRIVSKLISIYNEILEDTN